MSRADRHSLRAPLRLQHPDASVSLGEGVDISRGGIGFLASQPLTRGTCLDLQLPAPDCGELRLVVEVAWSRLGSAPGRGAHRHGARLRALGVRDARLLERLLARFAAPELPAGG